MSSATLRARFLPALPSTAVRYDVAQTLNSMQQEQARTNVGIDLSSLVTDLPQVIPDVIADCTTGTDGTDNTNAINAALAAGSLIYLPQGGYRITGALLVSNYEGAGIVGDGPGKTIIWVDSASAKGITVDVYAERPFLANFSVRRAGSITASSGASNIEIVGSTDGAILENLYSQGGYDGYLLGAGNGFVSTCVALGNQRDGFRLSDVSAVGPLQWSMHKCLSLENKVNGYTVAATQGSCSVSDMVNLQSFANSGKGFAAIGLSGKSIEGLRLTSCFFGQDGSDEVYLDTYNTFPHVLNKVETELAGTGTTGIGLGTSASNVGGGFLITANNLAATALIGCVANANSQSGLKASFAEIQVSGGFYTDNGAASAGSYLGIWLNGATAKGRIVNARCGNVNTSNQLNGILLDAGVQTLISGCDVSNNTGAGISNTSTEVTNVIKDNYGYNAVSPENYASARTVNFNSGNSDTAIPIALPAGFTRYQVINVTIGGASHSLTTATFGLFTAAAGGGAAVIAGGTAITVSATADATANNSQIIAGPTTTSYTAATLYFRVGTAEGAAATGNVTISYKPLP